MELGPPELIIVLIIVILLFGVGRIGQLGSELGKALRDFRQGLQDQDSQPDQHEKPEDPSITR